MTLALSCSHIIHAAVVTFVGSYIFRRNRQLQYLSSTVVYHSFKLLPYFVINIASGKYCVLISVLIISNTIFILVASVDLHCIKLGVTRSQQLPVLMEASTQMIFTKSYHSNLSNLQDK